MKHMRVVARDFEKDLRTSVIGYRLSPLLEYFTQDVYDELVYWTHEWSEHDTFNMGTNNPVIYAVGVKQFIMNAFYGYTIAGLDVKSLGEHITDALENDYFEILGEFQNYFNENYDKIEQESNT